MNNFVHGSFFCGQTYIDRYRQGVENVRDELYRIFPQKIKEMLIQFEIDTKDLQEIRLRIHQPMMIRYRNEEFFLSYKNGRTKKEQDLYMLREEDIREVLEYISDYSLYAYETQLRQGFITIRGGHRVGLAGQVSVEDGKIQALKNITFLNIRVAHEVKGCAKRVMSLCMKDDHLLSTLIISPPGCGKTTLLRDMIRLTSGLGQTVGVVDERSEIGASYQGIPQNDLGIRTDVLDGCPKVEGFHMLIRSMSPDVIAVDEIGSKEDVKAIGNGLRSGCRVLATIHGDSLFALKREESIRHMMQQQFFKRYILLDANGRMGHIESIYNEREEKIR